MLGDDIASKKNYFCPCIGRAQGVKVSMPLLKFAHLSKKAFTEVIFVVGIGSHLKVSHIDQRICFGNELTNLSFRKSFFQIIAPYHLTTFIINNQCDHHHESWRFDRELNCLMRGAHQWPVCRNAEHIITIYCSFSLSLLIICCLFV